MEERIEEIIYKLVTDKELNEEDKEIIDKIVEKKESNEK